MHTIWSTALRAPGVNPVRPGEIEYRRGRDFITITELQTFVACRHRHRWRYLHGVTQPEITMEWNPTPSDLGNAFHAFMRSRVRPRYPGQPEFSDREWMVEMLRRQCRYADADVLDAHAAELLERVYSFKRSLWGQRMATAASVEHEFPFVLRINEYSLIEGTVDAIVTSAGGERTLLDFKTETLPTGEALLPAITERVAVHEAQAAAYCLAMNSASGRPMKPIKRFVFYFTAVDVAYVIRVTPSWLDSWRIRLSDQERALSRHVQAFAEKRTTVKRYEAARCNGCAFRAVCRAEGDPTPTVEMNKRHERQGEAILARERELRG